MLRILKGIICFTIFVLSILTVSIYPTANAACGAEISGSVEGVKLRMSFEGGEVSVRLFDTPASRELVAMLPLTLSFEDYAKTEKIAYLPQKLSSGVSPSNLPAGDFAYYSPWGNLAIFYRGYGQPNGLRILGKIEFGKETLAKLDRDFTATIAVANE